MERPTTSSSTEPLLRPPPSPPRPSRLSVLLSRAPGLRGQPALVRETAALQLEQRRADWAYSRPVVVLDVAWNIAFAALSLAMLAATARERPNVPVRLWITGYALQCAVHVVLVWTEYRRRRSAGQLLSDGGGGGRTAEGEGEDGGSGSGENSPLSIAKRCESLNTMVSFFWWIIGFYWVVNGGDILLQDAPKLYWLTVVFLAFDVVFAIFCVALACVIGIALCCCLPCIIAILYTMAGQEGASDADIGILQSYKYVELCEDAQKTTVEAGEIVPIVNNSVGPSVGRVLSHEDAQCCVCLTNYEDGAELHVLPCNHHFHSTCIVKWLRINATCPLCKYNIVMGNGFV